MLHLIICVSVSGSVSTSASASVTASVGVDTSIESIPTTTDIGNGGGINISIGSCNNGAGWYGEVPQNY